MKNFMYGRRLKGFAIMMIMTFVGLAVVTSCGTTSVSYEEAYRAGETIGKIIGGY